VSATEVVSDPDRNISLGMFLSPATATAFHVGGQPAPRTPCTADDAPLERPAAFMEALRPSLEGEV